MEILELDMENEKKQSMNQNTDPEVTSSQTNTTEHRKREDRRVSYTKKIIRESLLELLEKKSLEEITVKELCQYADINRATFYRYYTDIYDLFQKMEEEIISWTTLGILPSKKNSIFEDEPIYDQLLLILRKIQEHYSFYHIFFQSHLESDCLHHVLQNEYEHDIEYLSHTNPAFNLTLFDYKFEFYKQGAIGAIGKWVLSGCKESPEYISRVITDLLGC